MQCGSCMSVCVSFQKCHARLCDKIRCYLCLTTNPYADRRCEICRSWVCTGCLETHSKYFWDQPIVCSECFFHSISNTHPRVPLPIPPSKQLFAEYKFLNPPAKELKIKAYYSSCARCNEKIKPEKVKVKGGQCPGCSTWMYCSKECRDFDGELHCYQFHPQEGQQNTFVLTQDDKIGQLFVAPWGVLPLGQETDEEKETREKKESAIYHPTYHCARQNHSMGPLSCTLPFWLCSCHSCLALWQNTMNFPHKSLLLSLMCYVWVQKKETVSLLELRQTFNDWLTKEHSYGWLGNDVKVVKLFSSFRKWINDRDKKNFQFVKGKGKIEGLPQGEFLIARKLIVVEQSGPRIASWLRLSDIKWAIAIAAEKPMSKCYKEYCAFKNFCKQYNWS